MSLIAQHRASKGYISKTSWFLGVLGIHHSHFFAILFLLIPPIQSFKPKFQCDFDKFRFKPRVQVLCELEVGVVDHVDVRLSTS